MITKPKPVVRAIDTKGERHAVFAFTKRGGGFRRVRVSEWLPSYGDAVARYGKLESYNVDARRVSHDRTGTDAPLGAGGGPIIYLAVRSERDPGWSSAPRYTAVPRTKAARKARAQVRAL